MHPLTGIHLNGPINSGNTTIGRALARVLPDARFIDGDGHDAPDDAPFDVQWAIALERLVTQISNACERHLAIADLIGEAEFGRLRAACDARDARLFVVTLAPPEAVVASDRGARTLTDWERQRIVEMYREGYAARAFSDCVIDTAGASVDACATRIGVVKLVVVGYLRGTRVVILVRKLTRLRQREPNHAMCRGVL